MLRNIASNWVLTAIAVVSAYLLLPFTVEKLGREAYGVWLLIASITGYLRLLSLGAPMTSVRYVARARAHEGKPTGEPADDLNEVVGTFLGLYLLMGIASVLIGAILVFALPLLFEVPPDRLPTAKLCLLVVVLNIALGFVQQLPYGIMAGHHDFIPRNLILASSSLLKLGVTFVALSAYPSILTLAAVQTGGLLFECIVCLIVLKRRYPTLTVSVRYFKKEMLRGVFSFSIYVTLLQVGAQLTFETDSLVIGSMIGVAEIPYFTIANSLPLYFMEFLIAIAAVVMPKATEMHHRGDSQALRDMFLMWSKLSFSLTLLGGLYLMIVGPRVIAWWVGPEFEGPSGMILTLLMGSYLIFLPLRAVAQPILMGIGKPRSPTIAFSFAGMLNLVMSLALAGPFGLEGVAWGTAVPNVVFALALLYLACRETDQPVGSFISYVVPKAALGSLPVALFLWWCVERLQVRSFVELAATGIASAVIMAIIWILFVYRNDPFVSPLALVQKRR